jgi:DNA-binding Xre family transcriptional regulator
MIKRMVKVAIREMAEKRGITSSYQLMKALNVPPAQASKWFNNDLESISLRTLDKLCHALRCKPNDLLRYEPEPGKTDE